MGKLACCYFPTTTVLVDDQESFLSKIKLNLQQITPLHSFNDPLSALEFINKHSKNQLKLDRIVANTFDFEGSLARPDQHALTIDIPAILHHLYNPQRFLQVSDILVDYNMPTLNGIELCEKIKDSFIRKLMITGEMDINIAITAFNKGTISKFIPKQTEKFTQTLIDCIKTEKEKYFVTHSATIMKMLANADYNCLENTHFINLFKQVCQEHHIVEYYMIDDSGSFIMLDKNAKPTWFIVRSAQALEDHLVFAEDSKAPKGILDVLQNREKLVFLFSEREQNLPAIQWLPYLHPANPIPNISDFYYSVITDEPVYDSQLNKITSFEQFLQESPKPSD